MIPSAPRFSVNKCKGNGSVYKLLPPPDPSQRRRSVNLDPRAPLQNRHGSVYRSEPHHSSWDVLGFRALWPDVAGSRARLGRLSRPASRLGPPHGRLRVHAPPRACVCTPTANLKPSANAAGSRARPRTARLPRRSPASRRRSSSPTTRSSRPAPRCAASRPPYTAGLGEALSPGPSRGRSALAHSPLLR